MPRHDGVGSKGAPPAPRLVVRSSCFDHPKSDIGKYVHSHPFNNAMELLLPVLPGSDSKQIVITNTDALGTPQPFFQGFHAPLSTFVSPDFVAKYVKSATDFVAISNATPIDRTDAAAVSPDGKLHLALTKQSYETLGLVGTTSAFQPHSRHNVTIDLRAKSFVPGRKLHDRVQECLAKRAGSLEFLALCIKDGKPLEIPELGGIKHRVERDDRTVENLRLPMLNRPQGETVRGEVVDAAQPMEFDWGTPDAGSWDEPPATHNGFATTGTFPETLEPGQQKGEKKNEEGQRHDREGRGAEQGDPPTRTSQGEPPREAEQGDPPTEADQGDPLTDDRLLLALHEWLGAVACGAAGTEVRSSLIGTRVDSGQHENNHDWFADCKVATQEGAARAVRWTGLVAPSQVLCCVGLARRLIAEKRVPWAALTVWGFADAPVSWYGGEHGYALSGENDYSLFMLEDGRYLLYSAACGHDAMKLG